MTEIIGIVLTFLAGLGALAKFWSNVNKVLKTIKEVLDVPASAGRAIQLIDEADDDKTWTNAEIIAIKDAFIDVKVQFEEAKDALNDLSFFKMKIVKEKKKGK